MAPIPYIVGANSDRFTLKQSLADRNYLCPPATDAAAFVDAIGALVKSERIGVVLAGDDHTVKALSDHRERLPRVTFLPRGQAIDLCQDKYALNVFLRRRNIPAPLTYPVTSLKSLDRVFARFGRSKLLWCRVRRGSRSLGATAVASAEQARTWITQWRDLRGVPVSDFTLSEYLPGRHLMMQSVWHHGHVILAQAVEVLSYFAAGNNPSGIFSLSSLAKTVMAPDALDVNCRAIQAVDDRACGTFFVEVKETTAGVPCITEINAGRFAAGITALLAKGRHNMLGVFVRLATGDRVAIDEPYGDSVDRYLVRDLDAVPGVFSVADLLKDVAEIPRA
jgi:carbamoyl-phosphate synthase large subunit